MKRNLIRARNIVLHALVLLLVFIGSALVFGRILNQTAPDAAETMEHSTFPLVYMQRKGVDFNCLHGYSREMDVSCIRDSITPLTEEREIGIRIQAFSTSVESVSYEVLSLDGSESLENTNVIKINRSNDELTATLRLQNKIRMDQEYILKIQVASGGRKIYYYTHVLLADGLHTDDYLSAVIGFYDKTVNRTDLDNIGAVVEPDETTDNEGSLAHMDIHDSVDQLTWGNLFPQIYYKPTPRITEINKHTATLTNEYRIAAVSGQGMTEVYNVKEAYRVRFTDSRVFVLNFERTTDEIFNPENDVLEETGIRLGITGKDVQYKADEKGRVIAFVQENELWTYEPASSKLTQVFSFPQKENMDIRDFYDSHDIHILKVETNGDVWFAVSGYMNRGQHEGDNGVSLNRYEAATAMVDEKVFLQCMENPETLSREVDSLAYVTQDGSAFCILLEETLYRINLSTRDSEVLAEQIRANTHASSLSGRYFAWLEEGEEYNSSNIMQIDLETNQTSRLTCEAGERIRPVCYMREDLVYGLAKEEDLAIATLESGYFPMYRMVIVDSNGNELKNYEPSGMYVTDVTQADHMLTLTRVTKSGGLAFKAASADQIMDTDTADSVAIGTATRTDSRKQTQVFLRVGDTLTDLSADLVRGKVIKYSRTRSLAIPANPDKQNLYHVYSDGKEQAVFARVNESIVTADKLLGCVVDSRGRYVWVRGDRDPFAEVPVIRVPEVMRTATIDPAVLAEGVPGELLDLTGCTQDQILYFMSHSRPVITVGDKGVVTIVGYDEFNTFLLDPGTDEWYYFASDDSNAMFAKKGNIFYTYLE